MMKLPSHIAMLSARTNQMGAASVAIAMLMMFILVAAVLAIQNMSGSSAVDSQKSEEQVAALFLAESGVEAANATIAAANNGGSYTNTTCTAGLTAQTLGRGTFQFTPAPTCTCVGGACVGTNCDECNVVVEGAITGTATKRIIRTTISTVSTQGEDDCGPYPSLPPLTTTKANAAVFSNLAYRAKGSTQCGGGGGSGSSNASIVDCTVTGVVGSGTPFSAGSCLPTTSGWDITTGGTNNVSGMGIISDVLMDLGTTYTVKQTLGTTGNPSVSRHYVQTGVVFYPSGSGVDFVGSYGDAGHTTSTSQLTGDVISNWNCAPTSGTGAASVAAAANTLVYGFSSSAANTTTLLSGMTFGATPMRRQLSMTGTADTNTGGGGSTFYIYSQIWYTYNGAYYPTGATAANTGARFTGTIGAGFKGHTNAGRTTLTLDGAVGSDEILTGLLPGGDSIRDSTGTTTYGKLGTLISGTAGANNAVYNYIDTSLVDIGNNTTLTAYSTVLRLASAPSAGSLAPSDTITDSATDSTVYGTITYQGGNTANTAGALYTLTTPGRVSSATNNLYSSRDSTKTKIEFSTATTITEFPLPLTDEVTALTSLGGTGSFGSTTVTGDIGVSGNTTTLTLSSAATLYVGDALFGANIKPNTKITGVTGTPPTALYTVSPSQTAASGTIIARAAVVGWNTNAPFWITVSRPTRISGATAVCGGVCAFLTYNAATSFTLSGASSSHDWSSGFACLSGVDSASIKTLGTVSTKRSSWSELVQ